MEANETVKSIKQNFRFSCTMNMELENVYLLKWLFLMSEKDMNENVLKYYERCVSNFFLRLYLLLRLFCNLVLHFLPEIRQATAATTYNTKSINFNVHNYHKYTYKCPSFFVCGCTLNPFNHALSFLYLMNIKVDWLKLHNVYQIFFKLLNGL